MHARPSRRLALFPFLAALVACGGPDGAVGAAGTTRLTRGAVTATEPGAVTVNGIRLSTRDATVRVDDAPGGADDLRVGDVVTVRGTFDDRGGAAAEIRSEHAVRGKVLSRSGDVLKVGEIEVHVDPATAGTWAADDRVRVSGVPDDRGGLRASRIDRDLRGAGEDLEVKGFVAALDATARRFELRLSPEQPARAIVDYAAVTPVPAGLVDGAFVEVATTVRPTGTPPVILAASIHVEDRFQGEDHVEIEGFVTSAPAAVAGGLELVVDGVTVRTDGATRFVHGTPADLVKGTKVEVEGHRRGTTLHAEKVSFRDVVRITAAIEQITFTGSGTMKLLGLDVVLPELADYDQAPGLGGALGAGAVVQVRGFPGPGGTVIASRVVDRAGEDRVFLQGTVEWLDASAPASPRFQVLGVRIDTGAGTEYRDATDAPMTARAFTAAVELHRTVVRFRARDASAVVVAPPASTFLAEQAELEED